MVVFRPALISHYPTHRITPTGSAISIPIDLRRHLRDVEVVLIEAALEKSEGMVSHAANALKLQRTTLIEKMKKLMIERPTPSKSDPGAELTS